MQAITIEPNGRKNTPKQGRISARLHEACRRIVFDGFTIERAAEITGYHTGNLAAAIRKDHVRALMRDMTAAFMAAGTFRARWRAVQLLDSASDDVALRAARTIFELEGLLGGSRAHELGDLGGVTINIHRTPRGSRQPDGLTDQVDESVSIEVVRRDPFNSDGSNARVIEGSARQVDPS